MKLNYINRHFAPDATVGAKLVLDAGGTVKTMKEFKQEIRGAKEDLLNIQNTFGATSKEALNAAKRVAELEDAMKDANETAKLFDPGNKFQAIGNTVRGLVGGFTALQGALALAGVEGEDLQRTLLKVQGALAITEGLNVVADMTKDFQRLGGVLVQTFGKSGLIGIAIAGVAAFSLAMSGIFTSKQKADVKAYNDTLKDYSQAAAGALQKVTAVRVAFEQAQKGVISKDQALKIYNDTLGDSLGKTNSLAQAEKNLAEKADAYIKATALKAQANALFAKSAEQSANALMLQNELAKSNLSDAGFVGQLRDKIQKDIADQKQAANDIETLAKNLLSQALQIEKQYSITSTPSAPNPTKTPKVIQAEQELEAIKAIGEQEQLFRLEQADKLAKINEELNRRVAVSDKSSADAYLQNQAAMRQAATDTRNLEAAMARDRIDTARAVGSALGALAELIGKQTAAGKALAIAQTVINTWVGVSEVLRAKSVLPEPFATISKIANVTAIIATGLNAVKNIVKTQVPGGGGGTGANISAGQTAAPLQPQLPRATQTLLNADQLNQIGNATVRAFVVESDVSSGAERIRRLNRAARI